MPGNRTLWIVAVIAVVASICICTVLVGALALVWRSGEWFAWESGEHRVFVSGSGDIASLEPDLTGFDRVEVSHGFVVEIRQGDTFRNVIRVDKDLADYVKVTKRGNTLSIGLKSGSRYQIGRVTMHAEVTMPVLRQLTLSGASQASVTGFESLGSFQGSLSGASSLKGNLRAKDARLDVSGASRVTLSGTAGEIILVASGASRVLLDDFLVTDAQIEASGASQVTVHASGRLDADASGVSQITYLGNPTLGRVTTSFGSSVAAR